MLVQCRKYIRQKHEALEDTTTNDVPSTPPKSTNVEAIMRLFPESALSMKMVLPNETVLVTGRADCAFGYQTRINERTLLIAIEAKQVATYGEGEYQLIAYLAILQEDRRRQKK
jgi:hypothetical protein